MVGKGNFEHLPLVLHRRAAAKLRGSANPSPQALANKAANRVAHGLGLGGALDALKARWQQEAVQRRASNLPVLPAGRPLLLEVDTDLDIDKLRHHFALEIVAEEEDGYVLVAGQDLDLAKFSAMVAGFSVAIKGSATLAQVMRIFDDPNQAERLRRVLSESLFERWSTIQDTELLVVDVGVSCQGILDIPVRPKRGARDDAEWARLELEWSEARNRAYMTWDELAQSRKGEVLAFLHGHQAQILGVLDGTGPSDSVPDSLSFRVRISGAGFRDFVLNFPFVFEVVEVDTVAGEPAAESAAPAPRGAPQPIGPAPDAPSVCVIDSGIQEQHVWLAPAVDGAASQCFLPGSATDVKDEVPAGGHGTRVAGAILYGEHVPDSGSPQLRVWIQNARVLDAASRIPDALFPPSVLRDIVRHFHKGTRATRIFNQSINATTPCRLKHMSAWASAIDQMSQEHDVLFVQTVGNLACHHPAPASGIAEQLASGVEYPDYLARSGNRVANPGQSLQALTVGSIAYGALEAGGWRSFASRDGEPSAFSRSGPGIWSVIKPEVVEYGGDALRDASTPVTVKVGGSIPDACPALVRSTLHGGPAHGRDSAGTSFAAPKVARIAAAVQALLPGEPALLHRALVVQSARWPSWAEQLLQDVRGCDARKDKQARDQKGAELLGVVRSLGFGRPDEERATTNTDHRVTLVTSGQRALGPGQCDIYQVPVPRELSRPGADYEVRIDVTLSYVAHPRRTRRNLRRYLSTWLDWVSSKLNEPLDVFERRVLANLKVDEEEPERGTTLPWVFHEQDNWGVVRGLRRNSGTVQKDWAIVRSHSLPDSFCIAVRGHQGWSRDPDSAARYSLVVTLDVVGQEVPIYEPVRLAVEALRVETEVEIQGEEEVG